MAKTRKELIRDTLEIDGYPPVTLIEYLGPHTQLGGSIYIISFADGAIERHRVTFETVGGAETVLDID